MFHEIECTKKPVISSDNTFCAGDIRCVTDESVSNQEQSDGTTSNRYPYSKTPRIEDIVLKRSVPTLMFRKIRMRLKFNIKLKPFHRRRVNQISVLVANAPGLRA